MSIGFYEWNWGADAPKQTDRLMQRAQIDDVAAQVKIILENVRLNGDAALLDYAKTYDRAALTSLTVSEDEFDHAIKTIDPDLKNALDHCMANVRKFHEEQFRRVEPYWMTQIQGGVWAGEKITPISSVGLYVPGGKNLFPSSLYMLALPATIAGVRNIVIATPPRPDGSVSEAILYVARACGVKTIIKAGGAQAIAAMAYGTQSVPRVLKVLGPCSLYGAAAKQLLAGIIDPGMPAGPSEAIILCDETADPHTTIWDVLNEAEHGPDSAGLLVTHHAPLAHAVHQGLEAAIASLPDPQKTYLEENMRHFSGVVLTQRLEDSIAFCNSYAPEHVLVKTKDPENLLPLLHNAGEILLGEYTPSTFGNFGIGVNHVLPTGGMAHSYSATTIWDFLKRTSIARLDETGFNALKDSVIKVATYEGFPAHVRAITERKIK
jgi:histidinol dehydrogenase